MFVWLLVGCFFILMFVRTGLPFGVRTEGRSLATVSLSFRERLLWHRTDMYALGVLLLLSAIGKWFSLPVEVALILVSLGIVNLPVRYQFTTEGIACNNVLFRRWKDFEYVRVYGARAVLMPRVGRASLKLVLLASHQKEVFPYFQRFLQVRREAAPSFTEQPLMLWFRKHMSALILSIILICSVGFVLSSCGQGPDPSGLNTASQQNLTGVTANGTPTTSQQLNTAQKANHLLTIWQFWWMRTAWVSTSSGRLSLATWSCSCKLVLPLWKRASAVGKTPVTRWQ